MVIADAIAHGSQSVMTNFEVFCWIRDTAFAF